MLGCSLTAESLYFYRSEGIKCAQGSIQSMRRDLFAHVLWDGQVSSVNPSRPVSAGALIPNWPCSGVRMRVAVVAEALSDDMCSVIHDIVESPRTVVRLKRA